MTYFSTFICTGGIIALLKASDNLHYNKNNVKLAKSEKVITDKGVDQSFFIFFKVIWQQYSFNLY